jgi:hypothetical protein
MCKQFSDAHTSTFAQATAAQYLKAGHMPALAKVRKVYAARAQAMMDALRSELGDAVEFTPPAGGLFLWLRLTGEGGTPVRWPSRRSSRAWPLCPARRSSARTRIRPRCACRLRRPMKPVSARVQRLKRALEAVHA